MLVDPKLRVSHFINDIRLSSEKEQKQFSQVVSQGKGTRS